MTVLEIVDRFRHTEAVFKKYDDQVGACLYCQALFETPLELTKRYGLVLEKLLDDLEEAANEVPRPKGRGFRGICRSRNGEPMGSFISRSLLHDKSSKMSYKKIHSNHSRNWGER
jgi:hypothetical protein